MLSKLWYISGIIMPWLYYKPSIIQYQDSVPAVPFGQLLSVDMLLEKY